MQFKLLRLLISEYNKIDTNPGFLSNEHFEILLGTVIASLCLTVEMNDRRLIEERSSIAEYVRTQQLGYSMRDYIVRTSMALARCNESVTFVVTYRANFSSVLPCDQKEEVVVTGAGFKE
ncbi:hypothetical protein HZH66_009102 [Vespula vulgaris]|uniref:Uncharacterized protein n=1 Tax=Vespula vulgaris TaxID=7454 RepID=A0A834JUM1_VESVU|nr:hypothetical protein HZH66_009102 [Vespula vulgaris]